MAIPLSFPESVLHRLHLLPTPIFDAFGGVLFGRVLSLSVRAGLFEILKDNPMSVSETAQTLKWETRATMLVLDSLTVGGYLDSPHQRYAVSEEGRKWCLRESPHYLGHLIRYFETLAARWDHLEHSLHNGGPIQPYYADFGDKEWEEYVLAMRDLARLLLPTMMKHLDLGTNPRSILDLGGSHGLYSMECCREYPGLTATVMDFAPALRMTSTLVKAGHMVDRIHLVGGDILAEPFPPEQDAIFMFNIIHGFKPEENRRLVARALDALRHDGTLYVLEQLRTPGSGSRLSRFIPLMVGLNLLNEIGGYAYSAEEVREWCAAARRVKVIRLRYPGVILFKVVKDRQ